MVLRTFNMIAFLSQDTALSLPGALLQRTHNQPPLSLIPPFGPTSPSNATLRWGLFQKTGRHLKNSSLAISSRPPPLSRTHSGPPCRRAKRYSEILEGRSSREEKRIGKGKKEKR
ncbi:uncharacterized protein LOC111561284 isoform X4 [Felis catus]|uniref:uncharacterized protein LOC111561284 isoform X4 n=1 Tax=Felis catus TaxID=9685 RepID=UPI001D19ABFE|nr:uncharacterized protein LOC111561284 isoform X4 [Felis catus]